MPRGWGHAAPKERGRVERALCERGYNADATLFVSSMNWGMESCSGLRLILLYAPKAPYLIPENTQGAPRGRSALPLATASYVFIQTYLVNIL